MVYVNLFPSFAAFVAVAALVFPLYEGNTGNIVSIVAGVLVAVFVALGHQKQAQQKYQFEQAIQTSSEKLAGNFSSYQQQLKQQISELATATNEQLMAVWSSTQNELTTESKKTQAKSAELLQQLEQLQKQQGELANDVSQKLHNWLTEQKNVSEQTFTQVKDAHSELLTKVQQSNEKIEQLWNSHHQEQIEIRKEEREHLKETQAVVSKLVEENAAELNEKIVSGWDVTRESLTALRQLEKEHATQLLQSVEKANEEMRQTLENQRDTFNTAEKFYTDTYEQIKDYTSQLATHEDTLAQHHTQLIETQNVIKDSITSTLNDTMTQHRDVLTNAEQTLSEGIKELGDQRAVAKGDFENFLADFLDSVDNQEKQSKTLNETLKTEVSRLLEDSSDQLNDLVKQLSRTTEANSQAMKDVLDGSKSIIDENNQVLRALNVQTEETKATAKLLENGLKEMSTLNNKDMDILQRLMR
ncbi:hypothetical protein [Solibacillus sp. FSL H8-0538]|uniref:hypothetical protein n=1 Tax=Solibacillus sp. FSL H8-0538 TaxID=2921400 RepID=UPI0030F90EC8